MKCEKCEGKVRHGGDECLETAQGILSRYAAPNVKTDPSSWLTRREDLERLTVEFGGAQLEVQQWSNSGFSLRLAASAPVRGRNNWQAEEEFCAKVMCAPACIDSFQFMEKPELLSPAVWFWVSVDFPERLAVLTGREGLRWAVDVLKQSEAALRLIGPRHPAVMEFMDVI